MKKQKLSLVYWVVAPLVKCGADMRTCRPSTGKGDNKAYNYG